MVRRCATIFLMVEQDVERRSRGGLPPNKFRPSEVRPAEVCRTEVHLAEVRPAKVRAPDCGQPLRHGVSESIAAPRPSPGMPPAAAGKVAQRFCAPVQPSGAPGAAPASTWPERKWRRLGRAMLHALEHCLHAFEEHRKVVLDR